MKFAKTSAVIGASLALLIAVAVTHGQTGSRNGAAATDNSSFVVQKEKKKPKKPRGRLPNNYGKIGITSAQRTKIYGIQADYNGKIEALEKQIAELKEKRDGEIEAVLTPDQKKKLQELQGATKKKREASKKKKEKTE